jgi:hypothetical protein
MKTPAFWSPSKALTQRDEPQSLPLVIGRTIWENSPILIVIDLTIAIATLPALLVAGFGGLIVAPLLLAITAGPVGLATLAAANALLDGEAVSIGRFAGFVRGSVASGLRLALIPGGVASILIGTLTLAGDEQRRWMLAPAIVDGLTLSGLLIAGIGAAWLASRGENVNRALLRRGALIAGSAPQAIGGIVAVAVLIALSVQPIGPLMAIVLAAPFGVFVSATMRWVADDRRIDIDA